MSQPLESSHHDAYKVKNVFQSVMYTTVKKAIVSFLGNRIPILAIVCVHFTNNPEIFKMIVDRYN